ncbi:unnamed protein product [Cuscuta epithymum]|uniref:Uncharacterized protein n=1 Tax=Cuscuta epithymum TaxID=186058 RepID=A0AAV0EDJ5_9ASTE|nr:unnamed protein product [Cuscuta epithymum]
MEPEVMEAELVLPTRMKFKRIQMADKYPKGQARGRHWKHLKQIIQAENYQNYPPNEPTYVNIESPPSMHPCKKICDITGFESVTNIVGIMALMMMRPQLISRSLF